MKDEWTIRLKIEADFTDFIEQLRLMADTLEELRASFKVRGKHE